MGFSAADLDKIIQQQKNARGIEEEKLPAKPQQQPVWNLDSTSLRQQEGGVGAVIPLRCFAAHTRNHVVVYLLGALFLFGMAAGALMVRHASADTLDKLSILLGSYVEQRRTLAFAGIVASTFFSTFAMLAILFFCGFCTIAQVLIFAIPVFKGLGYGFSIGMLYAEYGMNAIWYVLILLFPVMFLGTVLLIAAGRSALALSVTLLRSSITASMPAAPFRIKRYCVKFIIFTLFCLLISILDAVLSTKFGSLFVL